MKSFLSALVLSSLQPFRLAFPGNKIDHYGVEVPRQQREDGPPEQMVRQKGKLSLQVAQV